MAIRRGIVWLFGLCVLAAAPGWAQPQVIAMPRPAQAGTPSVLRVIQPDSEPRFDPWAGLIREAATRFGIPEVWIREVMRMESGGNSLALSRAGAMGLMQVIPSTYAKLRWEHGLGPDPWNPRDNILAGAAYIREMYDQYGFPGFLAAYNAGPGRVDGFMNRATVLPAETVNYVSVIGPRLLGTTVAEGPLSMFLRGSSASGAPVLGPMIVSMTTTPARPAGPMPDAMGLVPRGMLNGPQVIAMPSAEAAPAAVPVPPAVLASLRRVPSR